MKSVKHLHHIIPRHAGGTNDPSNLVELTVREHAEAHRLLYEAHGRKEDMVAWKTLSGLMTAIEANKIIGHTGRKHTENAKEKIRAARARQKEPRLGIKIPHTEESKIKIKNNNARYWKGKRLSEETRKKISSSLTGKVGNMLGKKHSDESKRKMSESAKGRIPWNKGMKKKVG